MASSAGGLPIIKSGTRLILRSSIPRVYSLRNSICPITDSDAYARVGAHLKNFTVAQEIAVMRRLDGHKFLFGRPSLKVVRALWQSAQGTSENPFAHVSPARALVNDRDLSFYFETLKAKNGVLGMEGRGVIAIDDWSHHEFPFTPRQHNIADSSIERHRSQDGSVAAFSATLKLAIECGNWNGSGVRWENFPRMTQITTEILVYKWMPMAEEAYRIALLFMEGRAAAAKDPDGKAKLIARAKIIKIQLDEHKKANARQIAEEAAKSVEILTSGENWRPRSETV